MGGEIFISYRRADEAWARLLHSQLRAEGVEAWYDALVEPGKDWRLTTASALEASQIFVLLFSENAAQSSDIAKELAAAVLKKKLIIPVRLENVEPSGPFLYELASRNWINAYQNTETQLAALAKHLANLVRTGACEESALPFHRAAGNGGKTGRRSWFGPVLAGAALFLAAAAGGIYWTYFRQAASNPGQASVTAPRNSVSLAVLPFTNLSGDPRQEFFSDGMTEEITAALAKVPALHVVARTSAFQFKGENRDIQKIGAQLRVTHLIEGSVRKDGNQVRITAQLINAADGTHVWAESYDRELKGVFAVQEEVATAIAAALRAPLRLNAGESLVSNRNIDPDSYEQYLRAKAAARSRKFKELEESTAVFEQTVTRNPEFAPAWAQLSMMYTLIPTYNPANRTGNPAMKNITEAYRQKAESAARRAILLDPALSEGHLALGLAQFLRGRYVEADATLSKALVMDAGNADIYRIYANVHDAVGDLKGALKARQQAVALEPFVPAFNANLASDLWLTGQDEAAIAILNNSSTGARAFLLAKIYASQGRYSEAADALKELPSGPDGVVDAATRLLRSAPAKAASPQDLPQLGELYFVYLNVGASERAIEWLQARLDAGIPSPFEVFWHPSYAAARKTEPFKSLVRKMGIVDYWRARGWPRFCHPVGTDDFTCG
jgi:TolB-like protein